MVCFPDVWAPAALSYTTCATSAVLCLLTILGNGIIILIVIKDPLKKLHTPFNYFVVNLAVSDLVLGVVTLPVSVYAHYQEAQGSMDAFVAPLIHLSTFICGDASILSMAALAVDRYIAITFPIKYRQYLSWSHCAIVTIAIWVVSISVPFLYLKIHYINYLMFYAHSSILIALIVICVVYCKVVTYLYNQTIKLRKILRLNSTDGEEFRMKRVQLEKSVTKVLLMIIFAFIGTYIPATIMIYILQFCTSCNCDLRHVLRDAQFLLMVSNSCMNPFICTIRLKYFKKSIFALFKEPTEISPRLPSEMISSSLTGSAKVIGTSKQYSARNNEI